MAGLEKILKAIEEEAKLLADSLISNALEEGNKYIALAKQEAEETYNEIMAQSKADVSSAKSRAESAAALQEKKLILQAKQEIILDVIESARKEVLDLETKEYFGVIGKMIRKHALDKEGEIRFSSKDLQRVPQDFSETIQIALEDKKSAHLGISKESISIDGGFILVYGDVELNCSFESLFLSAKERLQDIVSEVLFR